jgi:shikimate kinase
MKNIVLIGMPGAGKSTAGVVLAKTLGANFVDTDLLIQERAGKRLQEILNAEGAGTFLAAEESAVLSLHCSNTVIATGGSVVLSPRAMAHLKKKGVIVYLELSFAGMKRRLANITTRGIVLLPGQSLRDMFDQRAPLYENYADLTVRCSKKGTETVVREIMAGLEAG